MATKKSARETTKKKVPKAKSAVKVIVLKCPNCNAEDEKIIYCEECDAPMDVVEIDERAEEEVDGDISVSKESNDEEDTTGSDEDVDELIESGGLKDIYSEGDGSSEMTESDGEDDSLDDIMSSLDED